MGFEQVENLTIEPLILKLKQYRKCEAISANSKMSALYGMVFFLWNLPGSQAAVSAEKSETINKSKFNTSFVVSPKVLFNFFQQS